MLISLFRLPEAVIKDYQDHCSHPVLRTAADIAQEWYDPSEHIGMAQVQWPFANAV